MRFIRLLMRIIKHSYTLQSKKIKKQVKNIHHMAYLGESLLKMVNLVHLHIKLDLLVNKFHQLII